MQYLINLPVVLVILINVSQLLQKQTIGKGLLIFDPK